MAALPPEIREEIAANVDALRNADGPHFVCPFLDRKAGTCRVYEHRPAACRTYGFYVERDRGLYCNEIEAQVDAGRMHGIVWGNAAGIESKLAELGETTGLL